MNFASRLSIVLVCLLSAGTTCTAAAQSPWYIEGSLGALFRSDASGSTTIVNSVGTSGTGTFSETFAPGYVVNLGLGYKLPFGIRVEGELGYAHYSRSSFSPLSTDGKFPVLNGSRLALQSGGGDDQGFATLNAFYDLPIAGRVVPYIGAGFGAVLSAAQATTFANSANTVRWNAPGTASVVYPVVLAEVGLTVALDGNWAIVPSYRFLHIFNGSASPPNDGIFKLGLRYSF